MNNKKSKTYVNDSDLCDREEYEEYEEEFLNEEDDDFDEDVNVRKSDLRENSVEWYTGENTITISITQRKMINYILKLAPKYPDEIKIICHPEDNFGTLLARLPLRYLKFRRPREVSEEQRERMKEVAAKNIAEGKLKPKKRR